MKRYLGLVLLAASSAWGVTVGDTYEQVIAEKGQPVGTVNAGSVRVLNYPDLIVKVKGDVVVAFRAPDRGTTTAPRLTAFASLPKPAAAATTAVDSSDSNTPPAVWETDFNAALDEARTRNCHLLILFTGSDWCPWCQKMEAEVYSSPTFAKYAHEKLVLVKLDFLRHSPQPDDVKAQNDELAQRFDVHGYPCAVIIGGNGHVVAKINGYQSGGPANFVGLLQRYE